VVVGEVFREMISDPLRPCSEHLPRLPAARVFRPCGLSSDVATNDPCILLVALTVEQLQRDRYFRVAARMQRLPTRRGGVVVNVTRRRIRKRLLA
jgi:hypothetical protein